eukprot:15441460-Alexandrium_andersonii.AAC.1
MGVPSRSVRRHARASKRARQDQRTHASTRARELARPHARERACATCVDASVRVRVPAPVHARARLHACTRARTCAQARMRARATACARERAHASARHPRAHTCPHTRESTFALAHARLPKRARACARALVLVWGRACVPSHMRACMRVPAESACVCE